MATMGRMPGGSGDGPDGDCVCPECGATALHKTGVPCYEMECPECGAAMSRLSKGGNMVDQQGVGFEAGVELLKAYEDDGKRYVAYACADDGPDLQKGRDKRTGLATVADVIDREFLDVMAKQTIEDGIGLVDSHQSAFEDIPIADPVQAVVVPVGETPGAHLNVPEGVDFSKQVKHNTFVTLFELRANDPRADDVFEKAAAGEDDRGVSVHGGISDVKIEMRKDLGGYVRVIGDGWLDHHALLPAGKAANPRMGAIAAMSKALDEAPKDELDKAEVRVYGPNGVELTGYVKTDDDEYKYAGYEVYSFEGALTAAKLKTELPRLTDLFKAVVDNILCASTEELPDKRAALVTAVNEHQDAVEALVRGGTLSKAEAEELTDKAATTVADATTETVDGGEAANPEGNAMSTDDKGKEAEQMVASLGKQRESANGLITRFGGDEGDLIPDLPEDDLGKAIELVEEGQARADLLSKAFASLPVLDNLGAAKAGQREKDAQKSPDAQHSGMSKEQVTELVTELIPGIVAELKKAEDEAEAADAGKGDAGEDGSDGDNGEDADTDKGDGDDAAKGDGDEEPATAEEVGDMIDKALAKLKGDERAELKKSLGMVGAQETDEPTRGDAVAYKVGQVNEAAAEGGGVAPSSTSHYGKILRGEAE